MKRITLGVTIAIAAAASLARAQMIAIDVVVTSASGLCLAVGAPSRKQAPPRVPPGPGSAVIVEACTGERTQRWRGPDDQLFFAHGYCIAPRPGTHTAMLAECGTSPPARAARPGGEVRVGELCLTEPTPPRPGARVELRPCTGAPSQRWSVPRGH